jgi:hypothetical protein
MPLYRPVTPSRTGVSKDVPAGSYSVTGWEKVVQWRIAVSLAVYNGPVRLVRKGEYRLQLTSGTGSGDG